MSDLTEIAIGVEKCDNCGIEFLPKETMYPEFDEQYNQVEGNYICYECMILNLNG